MIIIILLAILFVLMAGAEALIELICWLFKWVFTLGLWIIVFGFGIALVANISS